jgi:crotonobetainyl-CoA:carnitine CoA-transferase CaiB-like acyl-CoA transferase
VQECVDAAAAFRIPAAPVHNGATILDDPQVQARDFYERHPDGDFIVPKPPFLFDGVRPARTKDRTPGPVPQPAWPDGAPFAGLRVLDLGSWWVGAYVGSALGAFGADVVKVESVRRIDGSRSAGTTGGNAATSTSAPTSTSATSRSTSPVPRAASCSCA